MFLFLKIWLVSSVRKSFLPSNKESKQTQIPSLLCSESQRTSRAGKERSLGCFGALLLSFSGVYIPLTCQGLWSLLLRQHEMKKQTVNFLNKHHKADCLANLKKNDAFMPKWGNEINNKQDECLNASPIVHTHSFIDFIVL